MNEKQQIEDWKADAIIHILELLKKQPVNYSVNDYVTNFSLFVHEHETDEVISKMLAVHSAPNEKSLSETFDELSKNLTQRQFLTMKNIGSMSSREIAELVSRECGCSLSAGRPNAALLDAYRKLQTGFGMERLFYCDKDFQKLIDWEKTPPYEKYNDTLDTKLQELDLSKGLIIDLIKIALSKGVTKHFTQMTIRDIMPYMSELDSIRGCGPRKAALMKDALIKAMKSKPSEYEKDKLCQ